MASVQVSIQTSMTDMTQMAETTSRAETAGSDHHGMAAGMAHGNDERLSLETPMELEAAMAAAASSAASTPCSSAVLSTTSTSALTLCGFSRQNSALSQLNGLSNEDAVSTTSTTSTTTPMRMMSHEDDCEQQWPIGITRVASEQLLPRVPDSAVMVPSSITSAPRASSMVVSKATTTSRRRARNPRRFVVTELPPDQDEFLSDSAPAPHDTDNSSCTSGVQSAAAMDADGQHVAAAAAPPTAAAVCGAFRPSKMEVRGRFTIIDLSPDSPESGSQPDANAQTPVPGMGGGMALSRHPSRASSNGVMANGTPTAASTTVRRRQPPPRRVSRTERLMANGMSSMATTGSTATSTSSTAGARMMGGSTSTSTSTTPTSASMAAFSFGSRAISESSVLTAAMLQDDRNHNQCGTRNGPSGPNGHALGAQQSPLRVDLSALDRHLVFLQQESHDMKALLESMISSNARWITALAASPENSTNNNMDSGKNPKAVHPATAPTMEQSHLHAGVVAVPEEPTLEQKHEKLQHAHSDLQAKYDALLRESSQLQRNNIMLETRLRQETSVNEELRIHVDQLTQYTESLILGGDAPFDSEPQRRQESLSSSSTDVVAPDQELLMPAAPQSLTRRSKPSTPVLQPHDHSSHHHASPHFHQRTISDVSVDSAALWMMDNNQSGLEDDDDSNVDDSDDLDTNSARGVALANARRRRWRNVSRSTSMSLEDDSASSSGYRDSWVSLLDPLHGFDGVSEDASGDDDRARCKSSAGKIRMDSSDSSVLLMAEPTNNQIEEEEEEEHDEATSGDWARRRKSSAMNVAELENEPTPPTPQLAQPQQASDA